MNHLSMNNRLIIGMDGGGTKTRVMVKERLDGEILFDQNFGMSNYNNIGVEVQIQPVDMFPHTSHVECVAELILK